jgi:hypothetical protein
MESAVRCQLRGYLAKTNAIEFGENNGGGRLFLGPTITVSHRLRFYLCLCVSILVSPGCIVTITDGYRQAQANLFAVVMHWVVFI